MYLETVAQGTFGYIDRVWYETREVETGVVWEGREVYVKRPIWKDYSLLMEACIQKKVSEVLERAGFVNGAPRIIHVFSLRNGSVCFAMEPIPNSMPLDHFLVGCTEEEMREVLREGLIQIAAMLWTLQHTLSMNHRDLKPSNFLVTRHPVPVHCVFTIDTEIVEIHTRYTLTLIDFGFACMGDTVSLGGVYSTEDPCLKEGRDLFLFLGVLYFEHDDRLPADFRALLERWLSIPSDPPTPFDSKLRLLDTSAYLEWLYGVAGHPDLRFMECTPQQILSSLGAYLVHGA